VVEWPWLGEAGLRQRSPDISRVIQEIVSRRDWVQGNALALLVTGTGERVAESYDGDPDGAPLLHVEYRSAGGTPSTITTSTTMTTSTSTTTTTITGSCGDDQVNHPAEQCDGQDDAACPGFCLADCRCGVVNIQVAASEDDAEERDSGKMKLTSSDLEMVYDKGLQKVGMRFTGVNIPRDAVIDLAYLQFQADEQGFVQTDLTIAGEDTGDAVVFSSTDNDISLRTRTTAEVFWGGVVQWSQIGAAGLDQRSPDISQVIQEIVSRTDWVEGNSLVVIITGSGERVAESFDGDPNAAPLLHVEYGTGG
jgi:hypothetical protein